jgi:hypothetical protein
MEVESFENEEVAKILNDWFVSIKVVLCSYIHLLLVVSIIIHCMSGVWKLKVLCNCNSSSDY